MRRWDLYDKMERKMLWKYMMKENCEKKEVIKKHVCQPYQHLAGEEIQSNSRLGGDHPPQQGSQYVTQDN